MQVEDFSASPVGQLVPVSGHDAVRRRDYNHFAFIPNALPFELTLSMSTYKILGEADRALGTLDAKLNHLPNPKLLVRPSLTREAVSTSALEGTYAPISDVLEARYVDDTKKSAEVREISNYIDAALRGLELIQQRPVCLSVLAELQQILVHRTRGDSYDAGKLRERIVCIGDRGQGIEESRFVPPPHGSPLIEGISDWERWINADDDVPLLVKAALGHYQFETLHPFSDGNGRIGRLAVTLQLIDAGALTYPVLNLSPWLEPRREEYTDLLLGISKTGNYDPWVRFFGTAVRSQSDAACSTIDSLIEFRDATIQLLRDERAKGVIVDVVNDLIGTPIMTASELAKAYGVTYQAANNIIARLESLGVVREATGKPYGRLYICDPVAEIIFGHGI